MSRLITIAGFVLCSLTFALLSFYARLRPQLLAGPGDLLGVVMSRRPARVVLLVFWWWIGWHFLVEP